MMVRGRGKRCQGAPLRKHRLRTVWRAMLGRFERSGQTPKQFCAAEDLVLRTFSTCREKTTTAWFSTDTDRYSA